MAESKTAAYVKDVTLCPICLDDCVDPRSLPCLHTFCFKCIERHCQDKLPGDEKECPVCREEFEIPDQGIGQLRHNFFIDGLVSVKRMSLAAAISVGLPDSISGTIRLCEGCGLANARAIFHCMKCHQLLCESCGNRCMRSKKGTHKVVKLGEEEDQGNARYRGNYCDIHTEEMLKMYCTQCRMAVCTPCYAIKHCGHKCVPINEASKQFSGLIKADMTLLAEKTKEYEAYIDGVDNAHEMLIDEVRKTDMSVRELADEIKRLVDSELSDLVQQLESIAVESGKKFAADKDRISMLKTSVESFISYAQEIVDKGMPCDIARASNEIRARAAELQKVKVHGMSEYMKRNNYVPEFKFMPSMLIGKFKDNDGCATRLRFLGTMSTKRMPIFVSTVLQRLDKRNAAYANDVVTTPSTYDQYRPLIDDIDDNEARVSVLRALVDSNRLQLSNEIGTGSFGKVYRGVYEDSNGAKLDVAVKVAHSDRMHSKIEFLMEAAMMAEFQHPNVMSLLAIVVDGLTPRVVLPLMHNGDLRSFIMKPSNIFLLRDLLEFGRQVAEGMAYLSPKLVHRDVAARNCMVDRNMLVKIADFDLARFTNEKDYYCTLTRERPLPFKWLALESMDFDNPVFTTKSDVWAFGILMYELITRGAKPYMDIEPTNLRRRLRSGYRLEQPSCAPDDIYQLMLSCWDVNPSSRPSFRELADYLQARLDSDEGVNRSSNMSIEEAAAYRSRNSEAAR